MFGAGWLAARQSSRRDLWTLVPLDLLSGPLGSRSKFGFRWGLDAVLAEDGKVEDPVDLVPLLPSGKG